MVQARGFILNCDVMSNKTKILLGCALVFVLLGVFMFIASNRRTENAITEARYARRAKISKRHAANDMVRMHMMTPDETIRFQNITDSVLQTHAISDDDLNWMLALLNKPLDKPTDSTQMHYIDLGTLEYVKTTTPQQQDKVFSALLPLLFGNDPLDKISADGTLVAFKVTKAVPYIQAQLQDPSSYVKARAKRALTKLAS